MESWHKVDRYHFDTQVSPRSTYIERMVSVYMATCLNIFDLNLFYFSTSQLLKKQLFNE